MKNRLLARLKRIEDAVKPQPITEIPPAAQAVFDRIMRKASVNKEDAYQGGTGNSKDTVRKGSL
jgi:hypothetical protein